MNRVTKYYIVLSSLTISLFLSILFLNYRVYHHDLFHLKQQVALNLSLISGNVSQKISNDIQVISNTLAELTIPPSVEGTKRKEFDRHLEESFNRLKKYHVENIELFNYQGIITKSVSVPGWKNLPISYRQYFKSFQDGKMVKPALQILPNFEKHSGKTLLILMPIFNTEGEFNGAASAFLSISRLIDKYHRLNTPELYFWLLERNGEFAFYPELATASATDIKKTMDSSMVQFINKLNAGESLKGNFGEYIAPDGQSTLASATVIDAFGNNLLLVFSTSEKNIQDQLTHFHSDHLIATLCVFFLIIACSLFVLITIIRWNNALQQEISERKEAEKQKEQLICNLEQALSEIKVLSGFLPICASCKKIRDDNGYWSQLEVYISKHSKAQFSHGICPDCSKKLYPDFPYKG